MPHQEALTIIARVDPQRVTSLQGVLDVLRESPAHNDVLPFGALPSCHFGRVLLLQESTDLNGQRIAPQLMMLTDCDGAADLCLQALVDAAGSGIDRLFQHCEGYPPLPASRAQRVAFLRANVLPTQANYFHRQGRSVEQIRGEAQLFDALQTFLDQQKLGADIPAVEVRRQLRTYVSSQPQLAWALEAPDSVDLPFRVREAIHAVAWPAALLALGPVLVPAALSVLLLVRLQELRDPVDHLRPTPEQVRELAALEDFFAHNGFTAGGYVKPGWVRQAVLRAVLPLIGYGTRHLFTNDSLAGVRTIHFARWIPLDGGRRVVFASNYDGSLEAYNNDFIDLVSAGLNLVFSNGNGYPETRWLLFGGATREQEFKDFLRCHQIPTPIWYSAYPQLTAVNVARNAQLRAGLRGHMSESEARQWLRLL